MGTCKPRHHCWGAWTNWGRCPNHMKSNVTNFYHVFVYETLCCYLLAPQKLWRCMHELNELKRVALQRFPKVWAEFDVNQLSQFWLKDLRCEADNSGVGENTSWFGFCVEHKQPIGSKISATLISNSSYIWKPFYFVWKANLTHGVTLCLNYRKALTVWLMAYKTFAHSWPAPFAN